MLGKWVLEGKGGGAGDPGRKEEKDGEVCGRGQGLGGMMRAAAEGTLGGENWGGRIAHLNMKLITCNYNANDMQMSTGFLCVHSSGILFLGLRIGANLHPVPCPVPCFFIINIFRGRTQGLTC